MGITKNQLRFQQESIGKEQAIIDAGQVLLENNFIEEPYIQSMLAKEETDITYIGNGIAIPHGKNEDIKYVKDSGISIIHYPNGIQYDNEIVYLLIGIAGKGGEHLEILQNLAIKLSDEDFVNKLVAAPSAEDFITLFNS